MKLLNLASALLMVAIMAGCGTTQPADIVASASRDRINAALDRLAGHATLIGEAALIAQFSRIGAKVNPQK